MGIPGEAARGKQRWPLVRFILLSGVAFIIVFPLFAQFTSTFFSESDLMDKTVKFIPRNPTLYNYSFVIQYTDYWASFLRTFLICLMCAVIQTFICSFSGYGFAKSDSGKEAVFRLVFHHCESRRRRFCCPCS